MTRMAGSMIRLTNTVLLLAIAGAMLPGSLKGQTINNHEAVCTNDVQTCIDTVAKSPESCTEDNFLKKCPKACGICGGTTTYTVELTTSNRWWAATTATIFIDIYGKYFSTGRKVVKRGRVELKQGTVETFTVKGPKLWSTIMGIGIGIIKKNDAWHLKKVVVSQDAGPCYCKKLFPVDQWIRKNVLYTFKPDFGSNICVSDLSLSVYTISVKTTDELAAGTHGKVSVIIYGDMGRAGKLDLWNSTTNKDPFDQGALDVFIGSARNVGSIKSMTLFVTNPIGWQVSYVRVAKDHCQWTFMLNRWFWFNAELRMTSPSKICPK